jgi:hypothetical protein
MHTQDKDPITHDKVTVTNFKNLAFDILNYFNDAIVKNKITKNLTIIPILYIQNVWT